MPRAHVRMSGVREIEIVIALLRDRDGECEIRVVPRTLQTAAQAAQTQGAATPAEGRSPASLPLPSSLTITALCAGEGYREDEDYICFFVLKYLLTRDQYKELEISSF
ncbi:unnamed protein product [Leptosia nina]|uniref:Uncharacterized protein n=1 Tax=Leptosia nina TaxID=320188 RepID=A0AAV1JIC0_9NEOP